MDESSSRIRIAAVHYAPVWLDRDASIEKACAIVRDAGRQGIRLLVFPEVFVPGFPYWINCYPPLLQAPMNQRYTLASVAVPGPQIDLVREAAAAAGTAVVLGVSEREGGTCYNTQVYIDVDGRYLGKHRKLQPTYAERYIWGQGDGSTLSVWDTAAGRVGGLACWENTMNLARQALIQQGQQIHAASWPGLSTLTGFEATFDLQVEALSRAHALTGQCFVVVAADFVTERALEEMHAALGPQTLIKPGGGWSAVLHPWGHDLAGPHTGAEEKLVAADVDLVDIIAVKGFVDGSGHYSRPEILRLLVDREAKTGSPARVQPPAG